MKKPAKKNTKTLPASASVERQFTEADYDFSGVKPSELESCLYYEYMRESEAIVREVKKLRSHLINAAKRRGGAVEMFVGQTFETRKVTNHPGGLFEAMMFLHLSHSSKFPDQPWQKLTDTDKKWLRDFPSKARRNDHGYWLNRFPPLVMETTEEHPSLADSTLKTWLGNQRQHSKQVPFAKAKERLDQWLPEGFFQTGAPFTKHFAFGFISINLNFSKPELRKAFGDWLEAHHPSQIEQRTPAGRKSMHDQLNALGALRLRYHCRTLSEAKKLIAPLANRKCGMSYSDRTAWNRACGAGVKHFHTLLFLPDEILPIHFTNGWQK